MAATLRGAKEIGFTVLSISISLIAVFIPLLAMGGIVGRLFREFAITLSTAIVVSMVISLSTTPHDVCLPSEGPEQTRTQPFLSDHRAFLSIGCSRSIAAPCIGCLENPGLTLTVLALTIALNVVVIIRIPKGFFPQQDTGALVGGLQGPQDSSFPIMNESLLQAIEQESSRQDPAVAARHRLHRRRRRDQHRLRILSLLKPL